MNIDDMGVNEVWQWLADHYGTLDYLTALDDERLLVNERLMKDAIRGQKRWGEGILKLVEEE